MFDDKFIVAGLEIGTSKVCAVVAEAVPGEPLNILGAGCVPSRGVSKGEIVNTTAAEEDIRRAVAEAEKMSDAEIGSVFLAVTGAHIASFNNRGILPTSAPNHVIDEDDVESVVAHASAVNVPADHAVIHTVRQHFHVDQHPGVVSPVGLLGSRLEVDVHVIHGRSNRVQNSIRLVRGLQLDVEAAIFSGRASALAVLNAEQCQQGALLVDLGAGVTEYALYLGGVPRHSGVLPVGGDHVTNDIAIGLKVTLHRAEQLKKEHGRAVPAADDGGVITLPSEVGFASKTISLSALHLIMHARIDEVLQLIRQDLARAGVLGAFHGRVFLTGGGARTSGLVELAEQTFQLPAAVATNHTASGLREILDHPEYSTAIGLIEYGGRQLAAQGQHNRLFDWFRGLKKKMGATK